jgi:UDP-N-acetylglucosamine--N-acetylmuramyl-(pentapeptide) pyrophosphoryl-undecaprenol N-acetylglucosamine transferase
VFFELISSRELSGSVQAIHMTGIKDYSLYVDRYQNSSFPVKVLGFISPIEEAYAVSDVVITRAGAATVSELGFFGIPSVFVPYPLADGHQKYNADVLAKLGIAQIIEQKDLSKNSLKQAIERQLNFKLDKEKYYINMKEYFKEKPAYELALAVENL